MNDVFVPTPTPAPAIVWHPTVEAIHRAYWAPVAEAEGMSYEQLCACEVGGFDAAGAEIEFSIEDELEGIRVQGCWAFVDARSGIVHAWAAAETDPAVIMHMLGHEVGHITGEPAQDPLAEEMRAEAFGAASRIAFELFRQRPSP